MKKYFFTFVAFLGITAIFSPYVAHSQCHDTLRFQIDDLFGVSKAYTRVLIDEKTFCPNDTLWIAFSTRNLSGIDFSKSDSGSIVCIKCLFSDEKGMHIDSMELKTAGGFDIRNDSSINYLFYNSKQSLKNFSDGKYTIKAWISSGYLYGAFCDSIVELSSKTVTFYVDTKAPVQQVAQETSLNVFPNPARERISVSCETEMRRVTLCNALGQQMLRVTPNAPQAELSVSGLPRGLYLLRVETAGGSAVRKVVVE